VSRILIVNADDFGRSPGINQGIIRAHEEGIVTSASLMVRYPAAKEAARYAPEHPELAVGLHVDLGEWTRTGEEWTTVYKLEETAEEVERQLDLFRELVGREPTHLDSHQHVHRSDPARTICSELASRLDIPLRHFSSIRYVGDYYGQAADGTPLDGSISVDGLMAILHELPDGATELACHPGVGRDYESPYIEEREVEVEALCDPRIRAVLRDEGIELRSFRTAFS
jgi:chitin disaccharide deacetylase